MSSSLYSLTHGWGALATAYISVQVPVLLGLIHGRAPASSLIRSPLLAIALMIVCAILWSQLADLLPVRNEWLLFVRGVAVSLVIGYLGGRLAAAKGRSPDAVHRRGAVVSNTLRFLPSRNSRRHPLNSGDRETAITIGGIPVALEDEAKHFKFVGTTGTGKSTAIREIL